MICQQTTTSIRTCQRASKGSIGGFFRKVLHFSLARKKKTSWGLLGDNLGQTRQAWMSPRCQVRPNSLTIKRLRQPVFFFCAGYNVSAEAALARLHGQRAARRQIGSALLNVMGGHFSSSPSRCSLLLAKSFPRALGQMDTGEKFKGFQVTGSIWCARLVH